MRPLLPLLISIIACVASCQSPSYSEKKDKASTLLTMDSAGNRTALKSAQSDSANNDDDSIVLSKLRARFAEASIPFEGVWVNEHYVNEIRQRKPLRESQDTETRCIVIPARTLQVTRWIYGFHEGGPNMVVIKNGSGYFTYSLYNGLLVDTLKALADDRLKIGRNYYSRIGEEKSTLSDLGVLEQLLFAGNYRRPDTTGMAVFGKNGKIEGLDSLGWYEPVIDYADYPTNIDHIRLGRDKEHLNDYGLRFVGDTMMIYSIECLQHAERDCVLDTLGHRMYALEKLK